MAIGAGKYDDVLAQAREQCGSTAAILMVFNGAHGPGFSCQADLESLGRLPAVLRLVADEIEADQRKGKL